MANKKSDVKAKTAFVEHLKERGFDAKVVSKPADILATKDGQTWYFEIKMTKRTDVYFGAATLYGMETGDCRSGAFQICGRQNGRSGVFV